MRTSMRIGVIFFLVLIVFSVSHPFSSQAFASPQIKDAESTEVKSLSDQVIELKIQNQILRELQSDILSTVYWSLGVVAAVFAVLIGYNFLFNIKGYEKDKASLKQELEGFVSSEIGTLRQDMSNFRMEILSEVDKRQEQWQSLISSAFVSSENYNKHIREQRDEQEDLARRDAFLEYNLRRVELWMWEEKGIYGNVALVLSEMLQAASKYGHKTFIDGALSMLSTKLKEVFVSHPERFLDIKMKEYITKALNKVPTGHAVAVEEIRRVIEGIREPSV